MVFNTRLMRSLFKKMDTKKYLARDEAKGEDSLGFSYNSLEEMWRLELNSPQIRSKSNWYSLGNQYWTSLDPTISNVLGGSDEIHEPDIRESSFFLDEILEKYQISRSKVLDCGAGIGRVSKFLLLPRFESLDMLEQCEKFLNFSKDFVNDVKVLNRFCIGAQNFEFSGKDYDLIWVQWVLSQLTDDDLLEFLAKLKTGLKDGGIIIFKENIKEKGFLVHKDDFSVTRCEKVLKHAFQKVGLTVVEEKKQETWPEDLLELKMFACVPENNLN
jgi:protein N-terminal methyltransferase